MATLRQPPVLTSRDLGGPALSRPGVGGIDPAEWDLLIRVGSNTLLYGSPAALKAALSALRPYFHAPIRTWSRRKWSQLPGLVAGTLILERVSTYSVEQQQALLVWLDSAQPVQVISTTERPLFDLTERGAFLSTLYYRLNTVFIDLYTAS